MGTKSPEGGWRLAGDMNPVFVRILVATATAIRTETLASAASAISLAELRTQAPGSRRDEPQSTRFQSLFATPSRSTGGGGLQQARRSGARSRRSRGRGYIRIPLTDRPSLMWGYRTVKTKAAILWEVNTPWSVEEIDLDEPKAGEVLVKIAASGLCHSDEHLVTGDLPFELPIIGGHEGAGVVEKVGENVSWLAPGDHVVFGFIPSCGRCAVVLDRPPEPLRPRRRPGRSAARSPTARPATTPRARTSA